MSKQIASRAWVCAFCVVAVIVFAIGLLFLSPAAHPVAHRGAPVASSASPAIGSPAARGRVQASYANLPLAFERNQGQTDAQVRYLARGNGYTLFLTENEAVFALHSRSAEGKPATKSVAVSQTSHAGQQSAQASSSAVRMQLAGANAPTKISAGSLLPGVSNYYLGDDPSRWRTDVPHYARVSYEDVYPGVNMAFHGAQRQVEFDFVIAAGANPAPIGFRFTGAQSLKTDDSGNLVIASAAGNVVLYKPVAYQEQNGARQLVDARFILKANNQISFELGNYDRSRELVIDPTVTYDYSTYLGGTGDDEGQGIAFDVNGAAYVTGETASNNFPTMNALQPTLLGAANVFVTKIAANSTLVYSTYIGGTGSDSGNAIAVDGSGDAFVAGGTSSHDFPHTGGFQTTYGGGSFDGFVFELGSTGALTYSTFLGGSNSDFAFGVAVGAAGDVYVVGQTFSSDFPTQGPIQSGLVGASSGFVTKLNSSGNALVYSTYLGGGSSDLANGVAVNSDEAYVTGKTSSTTFPVTANVFQKTCGSCSGSVTNAFVTVFNSGGSAYVYSSYLGGSGGDSGTGIAADSTGNAYVTGATQSTDFPLQSALQGTNKGNGDSFISKINPTGSALVYSTYLGGSGNDLAANIAVDLGGNAYVTGSTSSSDFPTAGPTQSSLKGAGDAFVTEINSTGSALAFSTYLGGTGVEDTGAIIGAIAVDGPGGAIYVTGSTNSTDFPFQSAFQSTPGGGIDAFVVKYTQVTFDLSATTPAAVAPGTSGTSTVTLTSVNGYSSAVTLACSVTGTGAPAPVCGASSFSPASPITPSATTTLTITTTPPSTAMVVPGRIIPGRISPSRIFYATWLPIAGLSLVGIGVAGSRRRKFLGFLMLAMVIAALLVMPACGGSSGGGGCTQNCGVTGGTPPGAYTVTVTGTGKDGTVQTAQVILTVN